MINLKNNFSYTLVNGENISLEYNKFYLKECQREDKGNIVIKKCFNLSEEKIDNISSSEHDLKLNLDLFFNDLYGVNNLVVFNKMDVNLKEGRYPLIYNEVIASSKYSLGDEIVIKSNKIINGEKVDIYRDEIVLKVVGICSDLPFIKEDKLFLYSDFVEQYLKKVHLINNDISLYNYFNSIEIDNYKYVLFFKDIDLDFLINNDIEYLSSSYEFYLSLEKSFKDLSKLFYFLIVFIGVIFSFYCYKLIKKKVNSKLEDIVFFKGCGVNKRKIVKIINKENRLLIISASLLALFINCLIIVFIFEIVNINYLFWLSLVFLFLFFSETLLKREVRRKIII